MTALDPPPPAHDHPMTAACRPPCPRAVLLEAHRVRSADDRELVEGDVQPVMSPAAVFAAVGRLSEQMADAGGPCGCGHALRDHAWGDGPASGPCLRGDCPCAAFKAAELRRGPESRPAWLGILAAWAQSSDPRPLDFNGADVPPRIAELLAHAAILRGMARHATRSTTEAYEAALEGGWDPGDELMQAASRLLEHAWATRTRATTEPAPDRTLEDAERELEELRGALEVDAQRLEAARRALVETGYFSVEQVGLDVAPRITELWSATQAVAEPALCSQCGERESVMVKVGTVDGWCSVCLDEAAEPVESRFPLTDDARKLAVDLAQAASTAAGVLPGEDITVVRRAVQRVLADAGVIVRVHWAHPTAHVPACMVADAWVYRGPAECKATREHGEVTCRECMDQLPVELRDLGTRVDAPAFPTPRLARPVSKPDDEARGEWLSLAAAWHDHETGDAWDRGEVLPWMRRIVELADPPEGRLAHVAYDLGGAGRACSCSRGINHHDEPGAQRRFYRDGAVVRFGDGTVAAMCANPDLAGELVALWNRHA